MAVRTVLMVTLSVVLLFSFLQICEGQGTRRCFECRSRGVLGDCRDHFPYQNASNLVEDVTAVPCASGWCIKMIEGDKYGEDHDLATERSCLQRIPSDNTERCAEDIEWNRRKVFACFCSGDLCNGSATLQPSPLTAALLLLAVTLGCRTL